MKKLYLFGFLLGLCFLLTACAATDPKNLFETSGTDDTQPNSDDVILYQGIYQYGNMQDTLRGYMLLGNDVLFKPSRTHGTTYLMGCDLRTGQVRYFCKDATCKHTDCASALDTNLEVYEGKLYGTRWVESGREIRYDLVAVNRNAMDVILEGVTSFQHHEDKLYFRTMDSSLMVLEEGEKEPKMVVEEFNADFYIIFGNYLYATRFLEGIFRIDLTAENPEEEMLVEKASGMTDGEHIYYTDETTFQLYRCNMDGSDPVLIDEREVNSGCMNFDEEYFYYRLYTDQKLEGTPDCYDIYRFPKDDPTKIEKIATLPVPAWQIYTIPGTGKIFVMATPQEGETFCPVFIMDCDGSNMKKLDIPEY